MADLVQRKLLRINKTKPGKKIPPPTTLLHTHTHTKSESRPITTHYLKFSVFYEILCSHSEKQGNVIPTERRRKLEL